MRGRLDDEWGGGRRVWRPIPGSRIEPARPALRWLCPRCGREVDNNGCHLVHGAPCADCREWLRDIEGDATRYDARYPAQPAPAPSLVADPDAYGMRVTVRSVQLCGWWWPVLIDYHAPIEELVA